MPVTLYPTISRANNTDIALREIFSKSRKEPGEAFYFFIPQTADHEKPPTYVYDTKLDRLLLFPENKDLIAKIEGREIDPEDWPRLLNAFLLNIDPDPRQAQSKGSPELKVIFHPTE